MWPSGSGKAPVVGLGDKVPQTKVEAFCIFAPNISKNGYRKCVFRCVDIVLPVYITNCIPGKQGLFNMMNVNWPHFQVFQPRPTNKTVDDHSISQIHQ